MSFSAALPGSVSSVFGGRSVGKCELLKAVQNIVKI